MAAIERVLFLKTHVEGYVRRDTGKYVAPHEDKRKPARTEQLGLELRPETGGDQVVVFPYASGMSRRRDMEAAIESAAGLGTEVGELSDAGMHRIAEAVAAGKPVFVDSGAFNAFKRAMREGTPELSRLDFDRVFAKYNELSRRVQERSASDEHARLRHGLLMMVAPDVIGDQSATLDLIEAHADQVKDWIEAGHEVIVPFQKGPIDQYEAFLRVQAALEGLPFVVGIPSAAEALSGADLRELLSHDYKPDRIHILGAVSSRRMDERMAIIRDAYEDDVPGVTADAMVMRSKLHELGGLAGLEKFDKIREILDRVVPEMWGGTLSKSFLEGEDADGYLTGAVIMAKADWSARYQRLLERRAGGDPEAMAAEDARLIELTSTPVRHDEPTPAQAEAGNYAKRVLPWKGLTIRIENEAGSVRRGTDPGGKAWETHMPHPYGYVVESMGVDGDPVDVYVGPFAETAEQVFVVHQRRVRDWKKFDEDKVFVGFLTEDDVKAAFLQCYDDPRFLGPITAMPVDAFVEKVKATKENPKMIKAKAEGRRVLFLKTHVEAYTKKDGTFVAAHEDGRRTLYHGSREHVAEIKNKGTFGGLFASGDRESAMSHGEIVHRIDLQEDQIMTQGQLEKLTDDDLKAVAHWVDDDDLERLRELVINDEKADDDDARILRADDAGEASWEAQRLRGALAKRAGFSAVEMNDEHGTSYLVLPGVKLERESEMTKSLPILFLKARVGPYIRGGRLVNIHGYDGRSAAAAKAPGQASLFSDDEAPAPRPKKADLVRHDHTKTADLFEPTVTEPRAELIAEHERLVQVLESPSHADDKAEAKRQKAELEEYKSGGDAPASVTVTAKKKIRDPFEGSQTHVTLSNGKTHRLQRLNATESMGLPGWHEVDGGFLADNEADAIAELVRRASRPAPMVKSIQQIR